MRTRRPTLLGVALAGTLVVTAGGSANGQPPASGTGQVTVATPPSAATTAQITLINGDVVTVTTRDGKPAITVTPHDGQSGDFRSYSVGEDVYVVPSEVEPFLASGQLDRRLFNVTGLIAQGYDDAHSTSIPLIVRHPKRAAGKAAPGAPAGSRVKRDLPSVRGTAIATDKKQAATFWEAIDDDTAKARTPGAKLSGGVERVWLDGQVKALLDVSVPQIGAPAAWAAGYDGTGVKVAVLDTGVDPNHPDLAGRIVDSRSFIAGESVQDGHGHGTHVAATIAGSGAASGGRNKGVAPGAQLIVGKVLSNAGAGGESEIIAGMDWAAHSGAKVVSMSLGGTAQDGADPMAEAVNTLTAETGVLFTIAAGNSGEQGAGTVGSPGIAAAALTVGAVDDNDAITYFSSRGPSLGGGLKPEITAPGWKIVAARAAGTSMGTPVDQYYTSASGTSMATPHVAGAAAILAQQHPDWSPTRLKNHLTSTAKTTAGVSVYDQGAGRTDVSRAVRQSVDATGALDFGLRDWDATDKVTRPISYVNDGDQPVTLTLAPNGAGGDLPAGTLTLAATSVTVPAHGTADVNVTLDPAALEPGAYGAHVTGVSADGGTVVATAVGFVRDVRRHNVTVKVLPAADKAVANGYTGVWTFSFDRPGPADIRYLLPGEDTLNLRLPEGEYAFTTGIYRFSDDWAKVTDLTYGAESGVVVDADRSITFDGNQSKTVSLETPKPSEAVRTQVGLTLFNGARTLRYGFQDGADQGTELYAIPSKLSGDKLEHRLGWSAAAPALAAKIVGPGAEPITPEYVGGWIGSARLDGTRLLRPVVVGTGRPQDYAGTSVRDQLALVRRSAEIDVRQQITNAATAGAAAIMIYNSEPGYWGANVYLKTPTAIPAMTLPGTQGATLARLASGGEAMVQFDGTAVSPYTYEVVRYEPGIGVEQHHRIRPEELATVQTSFHASTPNTEGGYARIVTSPAQSFSASFFTRTTMPRAVTEYVTAGRPTWESMTTAAVWESMPGFQVTLPSVLKPLERASRTWNKAVVRTAVSAGIPDGAARVGEVGVLYNTGLLDEVTGQWVAIPNNIDKTLTTVYRDGQPLGSAPFAAVAFPMSGQRAEYRVVTDVRRDAPYWTTSTRVNTAWTFQSAPSDAAKTPLPVLSVVYDLGVDLDNRVPARASVELGLKFRYPKELAAPRLATVKLWASYDDGATWRPVTVTAAGTAGVTGALKSPELDATNGFVSLRVQATDADGNTVEQTVTRAYRLRG